MYLLAGRNGPAEKGKLMTQGGVGGGKCFRRGVLGRRELMGSTTEMVNLHQKQNPLEKSTADGR